MKLALSALTALYALLRLAVTLAAFGAWLGVANHLEHARSGVPLGAMGFLFVVLVVGLAVDMHGVLVSLPRVPFPNGRRDVDPVTRLCLYVGGLILTSMVAPRSVPIASLGVRCVGLLCAALALRVVLSVVDAFKSGREAPK